MDDLNKHDIPFWLGIIALDTLLYIITFLDDLSLLRLSWVNRYMRSVITRRLLLRILKHYANIYPGNIFSRLETISRTEEGQLYLFCNHPGSIRYGWSLFVQCILFNQRIKALNHECELNVVLVTDDASFDPQTHGYYKREFILSQESYTIKGYIGTLIRGNASVWFKVNRGSRIIWFSNLSWEGGSGASWRNLNVSYPNYNLDFDLMYKGPHLIEDIEDRISIGDYEYLNDDSKSDIESDILQNSLKYDEEYTCWNETKAFKEKGSVPILVTDGYCKNCANAECYWHRDRDEGEKVENLIWGDGRLCYCAEHAWQDCRLAVGHKKARR